MNSARRIRCGIRQRMHLLAAAALVAIIGAVPLTSALAEGETPPAPTGERLDQQLGRCIDRLHKWDDAQGNSLERAAQAVDRVEEALGKVEAEGIDVSEGEALLAQMVSLLAAASQHHDEAGAILDGHLGYDADGSVVNREQARDTCRTGRDALASAKDSLLDMRRVGRELRQLAREWRKDYRPTPAPSGE